METSKKVRKIISKEEREIIFNKTGGRCHFCGEQLLENWTVDHIQTVISGGNHSIENFLPSCSECNRLLWLYKPQTRKYIFQIGIYAKTEVMNKTVLGGKIDKLYTSKLLNKEKRRKK